MPQYNLVTMKKTMCLFFFLILCGCADNRPVQTIPQAVPVLSRDIPVPSLEKDDVSGIVKTEVAESTNAIQQSTQALLGASIGKIAEKVDAALAKIEANVNTKVDAQANLIATLKADLKAELNLAAKIEAQAIATANLEANINTKLDAFGAAQGAAVAGWNNRLSETVQKLDAGRDVNNTQFTSEMADVMERAFKSVTTTVYIMAGALVAILSGASIVINRTKEASRQRSEDRANNMQNLLVQRIKNVV